MIYTPYLIVVLSLLFSAFFSGMEIAFVSSNKLHIELQRKQGKFYGKILSSFVEHSSRFIGTTLIGNTLSLVIYGIFMASILEPVLVSMLPEALNNDVTILIAQTIVSTILVLAVAEFTPKSMFMINPNFFLTIFAVPMYGIYYLLYPFVTLIAAISKFIITKILRKPYLEDKPVFGLTDLNYFVKNTLEARDEHEEPEIDAKIFNNALEFKTVKIRECMIPRTEMVAIDVEEDVEELRKLFAESGHSKILVYKNSIDEVIGYCHSNALFKKPKDIDEILNPIIIVTETMLANELMVQFITERKSIALVVDEFGGTSGIVSIEDIIEEIFGEIQDEHDDEDWEEQKISDNTYILSARHEIDYINEKYGWNIPDGDYDTLGGYILSIVEDLPKKNDVIEEGAFLFTILKMEDNRIDLVKVVIAKPIDG